MTRNVRPSCPGLFVSLTFRSAGPVTTSSSPTYSCNMPNFRPWYDYLWVGGRQWRSRDPFGHFPLRHQSIQLQLSSAGSTIHKVRASRYPGVWWRGLASRPGLAPLDPGRLRAQASFLLDFQGSDRRRGIFSANGGPPVPRAPFSATPMNPIHNATSINPTLNPTSTSHFQPTAEFARLLSTFLYLRCPPLPAVARLFKMSDSADYVPPDPLRDAILEAVKPYPIPQGRVYEYGTAGVSRSSNPSRTATLTLCFYFSSA